MSGIVLFLLYFVCGLLFAVFFEFRSRLHSTIYYNKEPLTADDPIDNLGLFIVGETDSKKSKLALLLLIFTTLLQYVTAIQELVEVFIFSVIFYVFIVYSFIGINSTIIRGLDQIIDENINDAQIYLLIQEKIKFFIF